MHGFPVPVPVPVPGFCLRLQKPGHGHVNGHGHVESDLRGSPALAFRGVESEDDPERAESFEHRGDVAATRAFERARDLLGRPRSGAPYIGGHQIANDGNLLAQLFRPRRQLGFLLLFRRRLGDCFFASSPIAACVAAGAPCGF